jgi:elongation factor Ts
MKDDLVAKIAEIGENIVIRRNVRFVREGEGVIAKYIHLGGKVGVLLEVGCSKAETKDNADFAEMVKDITLHIAAANPQYLKRDEVPAETVDAERAIYAKQVENKPANIIDKIVDGKLNKYYSQICLVEQEFVKDNDLTITKLVEQTGKKVGDELEIRRFVRYQIGA